MYIYIYIYIFVYICKYLRIYKLLNPLVHVGSKQTCPIREVA